MLGTFSVGRILGIPIRINPSWFLSFLVIVSLLAVEVFPSSVPRETQAVYWLLGLGGGIIFFASVVLHELGHCVVARRYSIPVSSITLFIFGGVSQIMSEPGSPKAEFLMAIAGPLVSFVLGGILIGLSQLVLASPTGLATALGSLGVINITLGVFNLLPGFPLDGGRVLRSLIWGVSGNLSTATRIAAVLGRTLAMGLIGFGILSFIAPAGWPTVLKDQPGGLWFVFIGLFLNNAAGQTQRQNRVMESLRGKTADQLVKTDVPTVDAGVSLRTLAASPTGGPDDPALFVTREGRMIGLLLRDSIRRLPAERWDSTTAEQAMIPASRIVPATSDDDGVLLLQRMESQRLPCIPVVKDGTVTGLVSRAALLGSLSRRSRLALFGR